MAIREQAVLADLSLIERPEGPRSVLSETPACDASDWQSEAERERARADAAEARAEELRRAEIEARSRAGSLNWQLDASRDKLESAFAEAREARRVAKDALALQAEVTRLEKLLSAPGSGADKRSTITKLRMEIARLRRALKASEARNDDARELTRENARLRKSLQRSQGQTDTVESLRGQIAEVRKEATTHRNAATAHGKAARAAQKSLSAKTDQLLKARERSKEHRDTIQSLGSKVRDLERLLARQARDLEQAEGLKVTIRRLSDEAARLRAALRILFDQGDRIDSLSGRVSDLRVALIDSKAERRRLEDELAARPLLPAAVKRLRAQDNKIESLNRKNARLLTALEASRARNRTLKNRLLRVLEASKARKGAFKARTGKLEATIVRLLASRSVLQKALFGSRSEQQEKSPSPLKRGQQPGAPGHGRTSRPALEVRIEERNPPGHARACSGCGQPYTRNGVEESSLLEIEVRAHKRIIRRARWRRACDCASAPMEVSAPPVPRLFARTPYGTSVWARVLFERYACLRPLHRVSGWMSDQGLPISPGTLADSVDRFAPLFEPVAAAILAHQNETPVRHGDETGWRIQELRQTGRSGRAWLWTSVSLDALYYHVDPSRGAAVARTLFGDAKGTVFLVCDRFVAYKCLARQLDGKVVLCFCWVHQRRDFIQCAAGQAKLTQWCQRWIERIASIYRLNEDRLVHYDTALQRQTPSFDAAQHALNEALADLFAEAERELDGLDADARRTKPLRSLLRHREGLSVFLDNPGVPMDNNAAERALRSAVIGRRLSFGSDSEAGARFTATMYSVVNTLSVNGLEVRRWLQEWLRECAGNGATAPHDLSPWLPWSMSEERRHSLMAPQ